jgi:molybdopterin/thiamine biosynthesis adenylyltransferase
MDMEMKGIKVIGLGGVGCALIPYLCRFIQHREEGCRIYLIDGDEFEPGNSERQNFHRPGNKARVKAEEMAGTFDRISIRAVEEYITVENVHHYLENGDTILMAVDNHATRNLVSRHCETLEKVTLISGGNEYTDGNIQVYIRREGLDITDPLTRFHPEIAHPRDQNPAVSSCDELTGGGEPQLLFTNLMVAAHMLGAFYAAAEDSIGYDEIYFDLVAGRSSAVRRRASPEKKNRESAGQEDKIQDE